MIIVRCFELAAGAPINATIVGKIPYKSGQREQFKQRYGFDPYNAAAWHRYLSSLELPRRSPRGLDLLYQAYRWGAVSADEPYSKRRYVSLFPGYKDGKKRDIRRFGKLPPFVAVE